jgi:hypothetical protein
MRKLLFQTLQDLQGFGYAGLKDVRVLEFDDLSDELVSQCKLVLAVHLRRWLAIEDTVRIERIYWVGRRAFK